jgi:MFS superfamily sulfate permease-like transporter
MNQTNKIKSIIQWLSAGLLVLIVAGLVYLIAGGRPTSWPSQLSPLAARPAAAVSPLVEARPTPATAPVPTVALLPLELTVVHTNDTWGYLLPCG